MYQMSLEYRNGALYPEEVAQLVQDLLEAEIICQKSTTFGMPEEEPNEITAMATMRLHSKLMEDLIQGQLPSHVQEGLKKSIKSIRKMMGGKKLNLRGKNSIEPETWLLLEGQMDGRWLMLCFPQRVERDRSVEEKALKSLRRMAKMPKTQRFISLYRDKADRFSEEKLEDYIQRRKLEKREEDKKMALLLKMATYTVGNLQEGQVQFTPQEILELREKLDISQRFLAELLEISPSTVSAWEQGRSVPRPFTACKLRFLQNEAKMIG